MKRVLSALLSVLMLLSVIAFASCGGDDPAKTRETGKTTSESTKQDTVDPDTQLTHEVKDLHGHEFVFIVKDTTQMHLNTHEVYAEGFTGDKISDAVFSRNATLEQKYNGFVTEVREENPSATYKEALVAGEYVADYFFDTLQNIRAITTTSLLADFRTLDSIDLDKVWWDQGIRQGLAVQGKVFCLAGDANTLDDRSCWIMYFNKDMVNGAMQQSTSGIFNGYVDSDGNGDFYQFVIDGKWTADAMYEIMLSAKDDRDGNGAFEPSVDVFGYIGESGNNYFHIAAAGLYVCEFGPDGQVTIPDTLSSEILQAWTALKPVLTSPYRYVSDQGGLFRSGFSAFFACNLGSVLNNTNMNVDYGLIPLPKPLASQDKYYTGMSCNICGVYAVPNVALNAEDAVSNGFTNGVEQAAYFLDAFGYYSVDTLTYAFYDQVISKQLLQDNKSKETLALALENKVYDPVILYAFGYLQAAFMEAGSPFGDSQPGSDLLYETLASKYEARAGGARTAYEDWVNNILGLV